MTFDFVIACVMFGLVVLVLFVLVIGAIAVHADRRDDWNSEI